MVVVFLFCFVFIINFKKTKFFCSGAGGSVWITAKSIIGSGGLKQLFDACKWYFNTKAIAVSDICQRWLDDISQFVCRISWWCWRYVLFSYSCYMFHCLSSNECRWWSCCNLLRIDWKLSQRSGMFFSRFKCVIVWRKWLIDVTRKAAGGRSLKLTAAGTAGTIWLKVTRFLFR